MEKKIAKLIQNHGKIPHLISLGRPWNSILLFLSTILGGLLMTGLITPPLIATGIVFVLLYTTFNSFEKESRVMRYANFILTAAVFGVLVAACGKTEEQAAPVKIGTEAVSAAQSTENASSAGLAIDSKDDNGWYHNFDQGIAAARKENKPVIVDFYTDWCHWCEVMDEKTFADPGIKKQFADGWITIKVNAEDNKTTGTFKGKVSTYREFTRAFGVKGFPSYAFIDRNGEVVTVMPGYHPKEKFSRMLDYMKNELYTQKIDFQKYVESES